MKKEDAGIGIAHIKSLHGFIAAMELTRWDKSYYYSKGQLS